MQTEMVQLVIISFTSSKCSPASIDGSKLVNTMRASYDWTWTVCQVFIHCMHLCIYIFDVQTETNLSIAKFRFPKCNWIYRLHSIVSRIAGMRWTNSFDSASYTRWNRELCACAVWNEICIVQWGGHWTVDTKHWFDFKYVRFVQIQNHLNSVCFPLDQITCTI